MLGPTWANYGNVGAAQRHPPPWLHLYTVMSVPAPQTTAQLLAAITERFGAAALTGSQPEGPAAWIGLQPDALVPVCAWLRDDPAWYLDMLALISGVDHGPAKDPEASFAPGQPGSITMVYHLYSVPHGHRVVLKVFLPRPVLPALPEVPSLAHIWRTADWHERETADLVGIRFTGHPDPRRIYLPEDWEGHPLRKDYQQADSYHGIKIDYYA